MKNADKPINPLKGADDIFFTEIDESFIKQVKPLIGLTKREFFAGLAMQGFCSNQTFLKNLNGEPELVVKACIEITEELLKQLENK